MQGIIESISEPIDVIINTDINIGQKVKIKVSNELTSKKIDIFIKNNGINYNIGDKIFFEERCLINRFDIRLKKIGVNIELNGNYPWIYLDKINGVKVKEVYQARHGFTAFFLDKESLDERNLDFVSKTRFSNRRKVFKLIRKYLEEVDN
jgi:hypothetical protein